MARARVGLMLMTIVTRCCMRPAYLAANIQSLKRQTRRGFEQIFIVDKRRTGIKLANESLYRNKNRIDGQYVYILDDDCEVINDQFIELFEKFIDKNSEPDIVMVKSLRPRGHPSPQRIFPHYRIWGKRPEFETTNGLCYVVKARLWKNHISEFGRASSGDWWFLSSMLGIEPRLSWMNELIAESKQLGRGELRSFEKCGTDWFSSVAKSEGLTEVTPGDWRFERKKR